MSECTWHDWGEWIENWNGDYRVCRKCGKEETDSCSHDWELVNTVENFAPNPMTQNDFTVRYYRCTKCGRTKDETSYG